MASKPTAIETAAALLGAEVVENVPADVVADAVAHVETEPATPSIHIIHAVTVQTKNANGDKMPGAVSGHLLQRADGSAAVASQAMFTTDYQGNRKPVTSWNRACLSTIIDGIARIPVEARKDVELTILVDNSNVADRLRSGIDPDTYNLDLFRMVRQALQGFRTARVMFYTAQRSPMMAAAVAARDAFINSGDGTPQVQTLTADEVKALEPAPAASSSATGGTWF